MEKTTFLLNHGQNELSFILKSKLDQFSAIQFLGSYLRSPRLSRKRKGRLPPLDPSRPRLITVKRTNAKVLPDPNFPTVCEGHILTDKGLTTRKFPFELKNNEQTLINFGRPGALHYDLATLIRDYFLFDIFDDGRVVRMQLEYVGENVAPLLQGPPLLSVLPLQGEEQVILDIKEELLQNELMKVEDKENFLESDYDYRALPSTNISSEAQRAQEELQEQLEKLKGDFLTMESSKNLEIQTFKTMLEDKDKRIYELETKVEKMSKEMEKMRLTRLHKRHHRSYSKSRSHSRSPTHFRKKYRSRSRSKHREDKGYKHKEKDRDKREREREKEKEREHEKAKKRERLSK